MKKEEVCINLNTNDGPKKYLAEKLDNLLDGINDSYGQMLLKELISRLEVTIKEFNAEMNTVCELLAEKEKERQSVLAMMKSDVKEAAPSTKEEKVIDDAELNEWEKKLKEIEKGNN